MRFSVVQLRQRGIRLSREEIAGATLAVGDLEIEDWPGPNAEKRTIKRAQVYEKVSTQQRGVLVPLFEPQLVRMNDRWFVLNGWQIDSSDGAIAHYRQEWLVRMVE